MCDLLGDNLPDNWIIISNYGSGSSTSREIDAIIISNKALITAKQKNPVVFVVEIKNYSKVYAKFAPDPEIKTFIQISKQVETNSYSIRDRLKNCIFIPIIIIANDNADLSELYDQQKKEILKPEDISNNNVVSIFETRMKRFYEGKLYIKQYELEELEFSGENELTVLSVLKELDLKAYEETINYLQKENRESNEKEDNQSSNNGHNKEAERESRFESENKEEKGKEAFEKCFSKFDPDGCEQEYISNTNKELQEFIKYW